MFPFKILTGIAAVGHSGPYSSVEGVPQILPIITTIGLIILALVVRQAVRKGRLANELHYAIGQKVKCIEPLTDTIPVHSTGIVTKVHGTEPITLDVCFKDGFGQITGTATVEETQIVAVRD